VYRKIRNTLRYLFGNTNDFDLHQQAIPYDQMLALDQWALQQLQKLITEVRQAYDSFTFHRAFSLIYTFCTVPMSSIYMDVLKDRMYCEASDSLARRSAQTVMAQILDALIRLLAPILVHTAEEAWTVLNEGSSDSSSVHLALLPDVDSTIDWQAEQPRWDRLMGLRDEVLRSLEGLRQNKEIASNQEAAVTIACTDADAQLIETYGLNQFAALCIVSSIDLSPGASATAVTAQKSPAHKCQRCWNYWPSVGQDPNHPDLCARCVSVVA